jgi:hypothetical protein
MPLLAYIVIAALLLGAGGGWTVNEWRHGSKESAALSRAVKERDAALKRANAASKDYQRAKAELDKAQKERKREVSNETKLPEYRCPVPDGGRVLIDGAIGAANATAGGPDAAVPADRKGGTR